MVVISKPCPTPKLCGVLRFEMLTQIFILPQVKVAAFRVGYGALALFHGDQQGA